MLKKGQKIVDIIVNFLIFIVIIAILFCLYSFFCLKVMQKDYVNIFGYSFFQVATGSMKDAINEGDVVVVKINSDFNEGDIITYMSGKDFVTHRVIEKNDDYVITKGDNNNTNDKPIDNSLILGKVTKIIPNVKAIKQVLLSPKVILLIFVTLFCLSLMFSYNGNRIKIVKVNENNDEEDKKVVIKEKKAKKEKKNKLKEVAVINNNVDKVENKEEIHNESKETKKKTLDATQIIDINEIKKHDLDVKKVKKTLDATQIIDIKEIEKHQQDTKKSKKTLDATQIIDISKLKK